jgi:L-fuculose-phosphate aldolase
MNAEKLLAEFRTAGFTTCEFGLNSSHSGNMSVRLADNMLITQALAMLGRLDKDSLTLAPLAGEIDPKLNASKEALTHRSIYARTGADAIVHTHPPAAITLSLLYDEIIPADADGAYHFPKVEVVQPDYLQGPEAVAEVIAAPFASSKLVLARGHGAFAAEESLERAVQYSCILETSARIILNLLSLGKDPSLFQKDYFGKWTQ